MKKNILYYCLFFILVFLMVGSLFLDFNHSKKNDYKRTKVTLAEVAHTIFYAPQYVAIEKGYYQVMLILVFVEVREQFMFIMQKKKTI